MSRRRIVSRPGVMWGGIGGPWWWPAVPTGQMSWQLCFSGGKTADREWGRHQRGENQEHCSSGSAELAELNVRAIHPSIWLIWQNNFDVWNFVVAAHCRWQSLADINSNQIIAAKNSVLTFLSFVPWLLCVTPFVFVFFVFVFVLDVVVFVYLYLALNFCFLTPGCGVSPLRRRGLARVRYLKILPSDCLTKLATLEWTKLYVLKNCWFRIDRCISFNSTTEKTDEMWRV